MSSRHTLLLLGVIVPIAGHLALVVGYATIFVTKNDPSYLLILAGDALLATGTLRTVWCLPNEDPVATGDEEGARTDAD